MNLTGTDLLDKWEQVFAELTKLGWTVSQNLCDDSGAVSTKSFQSKFKDGMLNPSGLVEVSAEFQDDFRYLEAHLGFELLFDLDIRNYSPPILAGIFDGMVAASFK